MDFIPTLSKLHPRSRRPNCSSFSQACPLALRMRAESSRQANLRFACDACRDYGLKGNRDPTKHAIFRRSHARNPIEVHMQKRNHFPILNDRRFRDGGLLTLAPATTCPKTCSGFENSLVTHIYSHNCHVSDRPLIPEGNGIGGCRGSANAMIMAPLRDVLDRTNARSLVIPQASTRTQEAPDLLLRCAMAERPFLCVLGSLQS
ncbi:hypothetical protein B0J13DRAFT_266012 [Dactylonectria estremocensis]|uniref:Uncharacterized protein n=1 Tax=Dactylonectria estremocensis TaxID=1079267 RepID=A0A9P9JAJ5_9HYPO|nr:hypothetical protein B0J13DRAFT_266012 [Dactylonectria estremocensis]